MAFINAPGKINYIQAKAYCPIIQFIVLHAEIDAKIGDKEYQVLNNGACSLNL